MDLNFECIAISNSCEANSHIWIGIIKYKLVTFIRYYTFSISLILPSTAIKVTSEPVNKSLLYFCQY